MSRQVGSLHRYISHSANLQNPIPIIPKPDSHHPNSHHPTIPIIPPNPIPIIPLSINDSLETTQVSPELNNLITLQQQIQHPHTLTIHQLSSNVTSPNPPTPTPSSDYTPSLDHSSTSTHSSSTNSRAYRTFKRKFPNHPFPSKPGTARDYVNHPYHINTPAFLQTSLPIYQPFQPFPNIPLAIPTLTLNNLTMLMSMY